ncbi:MAG: response regulator transcription factor [Gammaproteobacteria bacterium]|nr:response regulator transcription factor [Gammaproteobacteria bacterium]MDX2461786.1 response regulator transcription factor [Gammaproteobacteria bacterium]
MIRVLLADDHKILRQGLRTLLEQEADIDVVGEADNGRASVKLAGELAPDVVIMDVAMPDLNGIDATHRITEADPGARVLALSMHSDGRYVKGMLQAGARGYILKDCASEELTRAIRTVMAGQVYVSPGVTGVIVNDYVRQLSAATGAPAALSQREREVLQLLAEGASTAAIAADLHLSVKTIETHRKRIMDKLELRSIAELTKYAIREGITALDR